MNNAKNSFKIHLDNTQSMGFGKFTFPVDFSNDQKG